MVPRDFWGLNGEGAAITGVKPPGTRPPQTTRRNGEVGTPRGGEALAAGDATKRGTWDRGQRVHTAVDLPCRNEVPPLSLSKKPEGNESLLDFFSELPDGPSALLGR